MKQYNMATFLFSVDYAVRYYRVTVPLKRLR